MSCHNQAGRNMAREHKLSALSIPHFSFSFSFPSSFSPPPLRTRQVASSQPLPFFLPETLPLSLSLSLHGTSTVHHAPASSSCHTSRQGISHHQKTGTTLVRCHHALSFSDKHGSNLRHFLPHNSQLWPTIQANLVPLDNIFQAFSNGTQFAPQNSLDFFAYISVIRGFTTIFWSIGDDPRGETPVFVLLQKILRDGI